MTPEKEKAPPPSSKPAKSGGGKQKKKGKLEAAMGLSYTLNYADEKGKFDELVEDKYVKIWIEPKVLMHIIGTELDFMDDRLGSEFIFVNPNSKGQCGCGESFMTIRTTEAAKRSAS